MRRVMFALVVLLLLVPACGDEVNTGGPSGPSSPTVTSVTITGTLTIGNLGLTTKLAATAHFAKGTTQDVTGSAAWTSSDASVATVSGGVVTAVAAGNVTITATYQGVSGSTRVTVTRPPTYTLSGVVTESVPTTSTTLSGVRVEFADGVNQGKTALTDSSGRYQIIGAETGTFNVRATIAGYNDQTKQVAISGNLTLDFALVPTPQQITKTYSNWQISPGDPLCSLNNGPALPCQAFDIPLHNAGLLDATVQRLNIADPTLTLQLFWVDGNRILAESAGTGTAYPFVSANMSTPGNYQLRVLASGISTITTFTLLTHHPN